MEISAEPESVNIGKALGNDPEIGFSIEESLERAISQGDRGREITNQIYRHGERIVAGPGKRIRMWAGYNAAKAFDPDLEFEKIIDSMIPVEITHGFSLLIDDVDDGDQTRRGLPTLHEFIENGLEGVRENGDISQEKIKELEAQIPEGYHEGLVQSSKRAESMAINYAIFLKNEAYEWISNSENIPGNKKSNIADILRSEEMKLPKGQIYDLESEEFLTNPDARQIASEVGEDQEDFDFDEYYDDVISLKTAPLFIAPIKIAGEIAEADQDQIDQLAEAVEYTAKAFQIRDDVIDIAEGDINKDRYSDIREGTLNKPIYNSLEFLQENPEDADRIVEEYTEEFSQINEDYKSASDFLEHVICSTDVQDNEVELAGEILQETPAIEESNNLAQEYAEKAEDIYQSLDLEGEEYLDNLNTMNWMAATRSK